MLLLDEPTANLDAMTERALMSTIADVSRGRTLVLVTHRLVGLETMDEVIALQNGKVVERGKHTGLLERRGYYWHLYHLQHSVLAGAPLEAPGP
jgi:ABC-type transport system involved in cytochrome bd biosynthesis fused ATPase/permease subunit